MMNFVVLIESYLTRLRITGRRKDVEFITK